MTFRRLFILGFLLFAAGIVGLAAVWHGTMGFSAAVPLSGCSVTLSGSANGGWALLGFFATIAGLLLLIVAFILALLGTRRVKDATLSAKGQVGS